MALKVGNVIQVWKNFDLPALQRELDTEAAEVARRQDESDAGRRRLIDLSREFKKTASEDVKAAVAPLLKNFQAEVDSLNKRSKAAEVVFLNVYKKLTDINDPVPLLEMIPSLQQKISRQQDLEMEVKQLRDTLAEYNEEFRQVRNQDVTIKQLKEKLRQAEDLLDSTVQARLKENEEKLSRHFEERERELMELNSVATRRLTETEGRIAALQATVSELQSELFDARSKADEAAYAKSEEMEMLMMDLERANQRCLLAEKEVVSLKEQLLAGSGRGQTNEAPPSADTPLDMMARPSSLQLELSAKEKEVQSLIEDVQRLQSTLAELRESSAQQLARLEEELQLRSKHIQRLETQLEAQKDYEEIRRELGVLKSIEFPHVAMGSNSSATSTAAESGPESGSGSEGKPLELLLLERNKTLQSENTELKVSNTDLQVKEESDENHVASPASSRSASPGLEQTPPRPTILPSGFLPQFLPPPVFHPATLGLGSLNAFFKEDLILRWRRNLETAVPERQSPDSVRARKPSGCSDACPEASDLSRQGVANWEDPHLARLHQELIARGGVYPALGTATNADDNGSTLPEGLTSLLAKNNPLEARLQEMLRATMERFSNQSLDTLAISRGVRELLSIHNIGQRLFAKFVLGLSQGTVSELLSKPKPWDKLTEKGRDSYRKMHAWACDETAVLLLKSLVPRKGKESGSSSLNKAEDSSATDERIAHILSEASAALRAQQPDASPASESENKSTPSQAQTPSPSPGPRNEARRGRRAEHDDISQEQLLRIYHEELTKMMSGTVATAFSPALGGISTLARNAPANCRDFSRTTDEMRLAYDAYQQELARWMQSPINPYGLSGAAQDLSSSQRSSSEESPVKREDSSEVRVKTEPARHSILRPTPTPPAQEEGSAGLVAGSGVASPLQRIASITNSLITQSGNPVLGVSAHRPAKAILPPITQQQFDMYQNLSTEEVVRKVKEQLSQYSISQRLFGESVLGLSQGSVSDLLARPKPWHMLTQKGREPFIRMKIFLEDENAVHKLVASQYKIAPDKLMRTGGFTGISQSMKGHSRTGTPPSTQTESSPLFPGDLPVAPTALAGTALRGGPGGTLGTSSELGQISPGLPLGANLSHFMSVPSRLARFQVGMDRNAASPRDGPEAAAGTFHTQGVYELAALTQDLDTQAMTTRIKEVLLANNIGQKLFGEVVLGLSQGSVSELLSKPKSWHMLSIKGREPFVRMQLWLGDPRNVDHLQRIRNERRDGVKKRSRDPVSSDSLNSVPVADTSSNDEASSPSTASPSPSAAKKQRVFFSELQKDALKVAFSMDPYPSPATMDFLARELQLTNKTVANWFHNHRMRLKQQQNNNSDVEIQTSGSKDQDHFDPVRFRMAVHQKLVDAQGLEDSSTLSSNRMAGFKSAPPFQSLYTNDVLAHLVFNSREACTASEGLDLTLTRSAQGHSESDDASDCESSAESDRTALRLDRRSAQTRSPRRSRKPAAPQWVNPHWQDSLSRNDDKRELDEEKEEKQTDNEDQS